MAEELSNIEEGQAEQASQKKHEASQTLMETFGLWKKKKKKNSADSLLASAAIAPPKFTSVLILISFLLSMLVSI